MVCGLWFVVWVVHRRGRSFCSKRKVRPNQAAVQLHTRRAAAAAAIAAAATAALQEGVEQQNNSAGAGTGFSGPFVKADASAAPPPPVYTLVVDVNGDIKLFVGVFVLQRAQPVVQCC